MNETSFKTKIIIGAVLAVLTVFICLPRMPTYVNVFVGILQLLFFCVFVFCMPWGWSLPNRLVAKGNTDFIIPLPMYFAIKVTCALLLGWAGFLYDLYKMFIKK